MIFVTYDFLLLRNKQKKIVLGGATVCVCVCVC